MSATDPVVKMQVLLAGASARLAWETDEEWAFREWAISKSRNITRPCVRPFTCESPGGPSCALAAPCLEGDGRGAYARSVEFWRAATSKARWEELVALRPYHVHPQLDERAIDCPLRPQRKLPYLILDGDQLGPTRKAPGELVRELDSAGLDRVVLLGDSLCGNQNFEPGRPMLSDGVSLTRVEERRELVWSTFPNGFGLPRVPSYPPLGLVQL